MRLTRLISSARPAVRIGVLLSAAWVLWLNATWEGREDCVERLRGAAERGDELEVMRSLRGGLAADAREPLTRMTPLMYAARYGRTRVARRLLDHGADPNATCEGFGTPLAIAAARGQLPMMQLLLARGANPDQGSPDGFTPLMNAAANGQLESVEFLLSVGADVDRRNCVGNTALDVARYTGDDVVTARLLARLDRGRR